MCHPAIWAGISLATGALSVGAQAAAAKRAAKAQNAANEYNARMNEYNAQISAMRAQDRQDKAAHDIKIQRLRTKQLQGSQKSAYAASGVQLGTGSAADVFTSTGVQSELDVQNIQHNADLDIWGLGIQGDQSRANASLLRAQKRSPSRAFGTTLLTGAAKLSQQFTGYQQAGIF